MQIELGLAYLNFDVQLLKRDVIYTVTFLGGATDPYKGFGVF